MPSRGSRRDLFARQTRKNEEAYVDTRLSDDAVWWANRPGPKGCLPMATGEQPAA